MEALRLWDGSGWEGLWGYKSLESKCVEINNKNCIRMQDYLGRALESNQLVFSS